MTATRVHLIVLLCAAAISGAAHAESSWTWLSPRPTGNTLRAIAFGDANAGVAVGLGGAVARTTDGGATWTAVDIGSTVTLFGVAFADKNTCVAVGDSGLALRSTNAGQSWSRTTTGLSITLYSVAFATGSAGVIVGNGGQIVRTTNAGSTWSGVSSTVASALLAVTFATKDTGTAVGINGTVLQTVDGGAHWGTQSSGVSVSLFAVNFAGGSEGFVAGESGTVCRTTDGGVHWSQLSSGYSSDLHAVQVTPGGVIVAGDSALIITSADHGSTWDVSYGPPNGGTTYSLHAFDASNVAGAGDGGMLISSTDGGVTWNNTQVGVLATLFDVMAMNDSVALAPGYTTVARTSDNGVTWDDAFQPEYTYFLSGCKISPSICFIGGTTIDLSAPILPYIAHVIKTSDAGATWTDVSPQDSFQVQKISFVDENIGWAVGQQLDLSGPNSDFVGWIRNTTDGGATWSLQSPNSGPLNGVAFVDENTGVCVGNDGTAIYTTDGGTHWKSAGSSTYNSLSSVAFAGAKTVVAVGELGTIVRSTNAGASWSTVSSGVDAALEGIRFINATTGLIVGDRGTVLRTRDGGATWTNLACPTATYLTGVWMTDTANAMIAGVYGAILRWHYTFTAADTSTGTDTSGGGPTKPIFTVAPTQLNFDTLLVGANRSLTAVVRNATFDSLVISSIAVDNPAFTVKPSHGTVKHGDSLRVTVTFAPTATGARSGHVVFVHNGKSGRDSVAIAGAAMRRALSFSRSPLDCGGVHVDSSVTVALTMRNTSDTVLTVTNITLDEPVFSITPKSFTLARGDSITAHVTFTPPAIGLSTTSIEIHHTGYLNFDAVPAFGSGLGGFLAFSRSQIDFGDVPLDLSRTVTVIVQNGGNVPVTITSANCTSDHFAVFPDTATLPVNGSVIFAVTFNALDTVRQDARLVLTHSDGSPNDSLPILGRGVRVDMAYSQDVVDFGTVPFGVTRVDSFIAYNRSFRSVAISDASTPDPLFTIAPHSRVIASGDSAVFRVIFTASELSNFRAPLVVTHDLPSSPDTVLLVASVFVSGIAEPGTFGSMTLQNFPNPVTENTTFAFTLAGLNDAVLRVYDFLGREIATAAIPRGSSTHSVAWHAGELQPGVYCARLTAGARQVSRMFEVVR